MQKGKDMDLEIDKFAKIEYANIKIDGITVIAGENNTGKSTVGKIVFSLFNAISDIDGKIINQRKNEIMESCRYVMRNYIMHSGIGNAVMRNAGFISRRIAEKIIAISYENRLDEEGIYRVIVDELRKIIKNSEIQINDMDEMVKMMVEKVISILDLPEYVITLEVLTRYFDKVFNKQINSLVDNNTDAKLNLNIKGKNIDLLFNHNECMQFDADISLMHKAIYIDNPFILDSLSGFSDLTIMEEYLKNLLTDDLNEGIMEGIIESVLSKEKLDEIYKSLSTVVKGDIVEKQGNEFYLNNEEFKNPISINNLSAGLKSFVIIKMLLEKGKLREKDVLILDEPEIHLHPQWQVAYAELVVLLQKYFDLSIVVATHSPYFLDAINLYSIKNGVESKVNYYVSSVKDGKASMEMVTGNIDKIYKKMATPVQLLDTLRYELNND